LTEALPHEKTTPFMVRVRETAEGFYRRVVSLKWKLDKTAWRKRKGRMKVKCLNLSTIVK
jgi:hypothetical protein